MKTVNLKFGRRSKSNSYKQNQSLWYVAEVKKPKKLLDFKKSCNSLAQKSETKKTSNRKLRKAN